MDVIRSLQRTNPEIEVYSYYQRAFQVFGLNIRNAPFDDVRVRHALQMALDLETINDTYFGGFADTGTMIAAKADTTYEMITGDMGQPNAVWGMQAHRDDQLFIREYLACSDPCAIDRSVLDAASDAFYAATTVDEQFEAAKAYNMSVIEQHNQIWGPLAPQFQVNNPWVKGYNGEYSLGEIQYHTVLARLWIDGI